MAFDAAALQAAAGRAAEAMRRAEQELNAADGKLGDGDTGQTMRRVFEKVAAAAAPGDDVGALLRKAGTAAASATGSSLGTLVALSLIAAGKATAGRTSIEPGDLAGLLRTAEQTIMTRGGAKPCDKSVLDAVSAVAAALERSGGADAGATSVAAARHALDAFRDKPCKLGRARMFSERSVGLDDPGMLAFARLVEGLSSSA